MKDELTPHDANCYLEENISGVLQKHYYSYAHEEGHVGSSHTDAFIDDYNSYYDPYLVEETEDSTSASIVDKRALSRAFDEFIAGYESWREEYAYNGQLFGSPVDFAFSVLTDSLSPPYDALPLDYEQFCYDFDISSGSFINADTGEFINRNDAGALRTTACYVVSDN